MLPSDRGQSDTLKFGWVTKDTNIGEPLGPDKFGIGLMLSEQRDVLRHLGLSRIIPMIEMRMSHDDRIDALHDVIDRLG